MNQALYNTWKCCKYKWILLTNIFFFSNYTYSILKIYCTEDYHILNINKLYFWPFFCQPLSRLRIYSLLIKQISSEQFSHQSSSTYEIHVTVFAVLAALGIQGSPNVVQHLSSVPHNTPWSKQQPGQMKNRRDVTDLWQGSRLVREAGIECYLQVQNSSCFFHCFIRFFVWKIMILTQDSYHPNHQLWK